MDYNNPHQVDKNDVGLSAVDNTSDADKPISDATQIALDGKEDYLGSGTNGQILATSGSDVRYWIDYTVGSGDVVGPSSAVDENIAVFDSTTGKLIKDGGSSIAQINSAINFVAGNLNDHVTTENIHFEDVDTTSATYLRTSGAWIESDQFDTTKYYQNTEVDNLLDDKLDVSLSAVPNGLASLDGTGTVPLSQLPDAVLGALEFKGLWNADTNTPTLSDGSGTSNGEYYKVSTSGTTALDGITDWKVGDWVINVEDSGSPRWDKIDQSETVSSVFGRTGAITSQAGDYTTGQVTEDTDKNYVTDAEKVVIANTSNTNTGDETTLSIQTKRPLKTVEGNSLEGAGDVTIDGLAPAGGNAGQVIIKDSATDYDYSWQTLPGGGDMLKATYDTNDNGIVDNSERLGGELPGYYATSADILPLYGATEDRPPSALPGTMYFTSGLGYPIWFNGTNWVNATGAFVIGPA